MALPADHARIPSDLRAEIARRARVRESAASGFLAALHSRQSRFIADPSRRKVALCSRRAGKSYLILAWLIEGALLDVGGMSVYVAGSKGDARKNLGEAITTFAQRWPELRLRLQEQDGQLQLFVGATRHTIWLAGVKDQAAIDKFRGAKYRRVAIDEAQKYGAYLESLVVDVFEPALLDKQGDLALCGTPGPVPAGLFYEVSTGDGPYPRWPTHHWTIFENPHIRDAEEEVDKFLALYGLSKGSATYRREYLGEWVLDEGALVYPFSHDLNGLRSPLPERCSYVLGVDIGFTDATAFVVVAVSPQSKNIFVVEAWKQTGLIPEAVAQEVEAFVAKYGRGLRVVVDEGGAGKGYAETIRQRYGIGCEAAQKTEKRAYQEIVAGELRSGTIKVLESECKDLLDEISALQWGPHRLKQDDRFEDHASDAFLYSVRASHAWYQAPAPAPPTPGTEQWFAAEAKRVRDRVVERVAREQRRKTFADYRRS